MSLKINLIANYLGQGWTALMGFVFLPLYIHYMGVEAYGLVGFYVFLLGITALFDFGLGEAGIRELARLSGTANSSQDEIDLVRTLEWVLWGMSMLVGLALFMLAPVIVTHWLNLGDFDKSVATDALRLMSLALVVQWPSTFYGGCIGGLQRQVVVNSLRVLFSTLRGGGAVVVLAFVAPTVQAFFAWQIVVAIIQAAAFRYALWHVLPQTISSPRFSWGRLKGISRFAAGMGGIAVFSLVLTNADKALLSTLLTLEQFGYYSAAALLANATRMLLSPVVVTYYPKFTQLVAAGEVARLAEVFHQGSQLISVLVVPAGLLLTFFSSEILLLWTHNSILVATTSGALALLALGTTLNSYLNIPYYMQLAYGQTKLALLTNVGSAIVLVPLLYYLTINYGINGAASVWVILNSIYLFFISHIVFRTVLREEKKGWFKNAVFFPTLGVVIILIAARLIINALELTAAGPMLLTLLLTGVLASVVAALMAPEVRNLAIRFVVRRMKHYQV